MSSKEYKKNSTQILQDVLEAIDDIEEFTKGMEFNEFSGDKKTLYAVMKALEIIGEATKDLPVILMNKYPEVPWKFMARTIDEIVHGHFVVDLPAIWSIARKDVPSLKPLIEGMLEEAHTIENTEVRIDVNQIRLLILERKDEIKEKFKAEVVGIFGSYARGEEKEGSDIDVLVRFGEGASLFELVGIGDYLEDLFGVPVDVVSERGIHPLMKDEVLKAMVTV
jgi:uncharacterized protein with HEPN domain/predicted nucleotidyltransferase